MKEKLLSTSAAAALVALSLAAGPNQAGAQGSRTPPTPSGQPQAPSPGGPAPTSPSSASAQTAPTAPDLSSPTTFLPFVYGPLRQEGMDVPAANPKGKVHLLPATPATTQWGWFDNAQPPVLHVQAGDTVVMETMMHAHNQVVPGVTLEQ